MMYLDCHALADLFRAFARRMNDERDYLAELDGAIGDADHGTAMAEGFSAAAVALTHNASDYASLRVALTQAGRSFLNAVGATTGPLYASGLTRAGLAMPEDKQVPIERLADILISISEGIEERGKASPGDKTMLDAWLPATHAIRDARAEGATLAEVMSRAAAAAAEGAEATRGMVAAKGRAARLGARTIGHLDPGAVSAAALIDAAREWVSAAAERETL
ncbi:dihydroxyacetone kinase subunit DhaL [Martelella sp. AMO21009]